MIDETTDLVHVTAVAHPFSVDRRLLDVEEGPTIAELLARAGLPLWAAANVDINGVYIPPSMYARVRPRRGATVTIRAMPRGGGGSGNGKNIGLIIAGILLIVVGVVAALGGLVTFGVTTAAAPYLISAGVGLLLTGVINILIPPPTPPKLRPLSGISAAEAESPTLSVFGQTNDARPYQPVPRLLGRHRMFPPYAAAPFTEVVGSDQYLRLLFCLGIGPVEIEDLKIGETPIENFEAVEIETRTGAAGEPPLTLYTNDVAEDPLSIALTFAGGPQVRTSRIGARELSVAFAFPSGLVLFTPTGGKTPTSVSLTVEYRSVGVSAWIPAPGSPVVTTEARQALVRAGLRWLPVLPIATTPSTAWAAFGMTSFDATKINDGLLAADALNVDTASAGAWVRFDSGVGLANSFGRALVTSAGTGLAAVWSVQHSDDGLDWTTVYEGFATGAAATESAEWPAPDTPARFWRLLKTNSATPGAAIREIQWWQAVPATNTTAQFDVRVTRTTADSVDLALVDASVWAALRTISARAPVALAGLGLVALRIKATDQLNGIVTTFNCVANALHLDYATYAGTVLADGPLGYWRLGEIAGAPTAFDASGHARSGTYRGGPALGIAGLVTGDADTAMQLVAGAWVDTFVGLSAIDLGAVSFTIEFAFKADDVGAGARTILRKASGDPFASGAVGIGVRRNGATIEAVRNSGGAPAVVSVGPITAGTTYLFQATYNIVNGQLTAFINYDAITAAVAAGTATYQDTYGLVIGSPQEAAASLVAIASSDTLAPKLGDVGRSNIAIRGTDSVSPALGDVGASAVAVLVHKTTTESLSLRLSDAGLATAGFLGVLDEVALYPEALTDARRLAHRTAMTGTREWIVQRTSNPASLYRAILQDPGNAFPVSDARLDLPEIQAWHQECSTAGRSCNLVVDYKATVFELLRDVAACGRATPTMNDGKYATVRDLPQTVPRQHFTPRNSRGFHGRRALVERPHALKVRFIDPAAGWQQSERIVYDDGYDATTATKFETLDLHGVTDADHAWRLGRYHIACARLRPETYDLETDVEHLVARRGDLVRIAHDVTEWGLTQGRVKSVTTSGANAATATLDEPVVMEATKAYAIRFRLADGTSVLANVVTAAGTQATVTFSPVIAPPIPAAGDLFLFGVVGSESVEAIVSRIVPGPELSAVLTLVDAAPAVLNADQGSIPAWDPQMTLAASGEVVPPTPVVISVVSDETVLVRDIDGSLTSRIVIALEYQATSNLKGDYLEVRYRLAASEAPFDALPQLPPDSDRVTVSGVEDGLAYDVRLRTVHREGATSPWAEVLGYVVIGKSSAPPAPSNPRIEGGKLTWDYPAQPLDFAGFEVRRSPGTVGNWMTALEMHIGLVFAPFDLGTIYGEWVLQVAAVDTSGNASDGANGHESPATLAVDFGAPPLHNTVATKDYHADGFPGSVTNGTVDGVSGDLEADQLTTGFWTQDGNLFWSASGLTLFWGGTYKQMTYDFTYTTGASAGGASIVFYPLVVTGVGWTLAYRVGPSGDYLPWPGVLPNVLPSQEYDFRLVTYAGVVQGTVSALKLIVDAEDIEEQHLAFVTAVTTGTRLTLLNTYRAIKLVRPTLIAATSETGISSVAADKQNTAGANNGPLIKVFDAAGAVVAGRSDVKVTGY